LWDRDYSLGGFREDRFRLGQADVLFKVHDCFGDDQVSLRIDRSGAALVVDYGRHSLLPPEPIPLTR